MKTYGSLRKYKQFLKTRGDFHNPSEQRFEETFGAENIGFIRSGYPDYTILDEHGEIIGFVEVKPNKTSKLRHNQARFQRFCEKHSIPFVVWTPDEPNTLPFTQEPPNAVVGEPESHSITNGN